jgi:integrase
MNKNLKIDKINIEIVKGKIRLRWSYQGQRFSLSMGENNSQNLDLARSKAYEINSDIYKNSFDANNYKPKETTTVFKEITLLELWELFLKAKIKSGLKPKTIEWLLGIDKTIKRLGTDLTFNAFEVSEKLQVITTVNQTRLALKELSACCEYGIKRELIDKNKFKGIWEYLPDQEASVPYCFSRDEIERILENFASHKDYAYYYDLIIFWLNTGCRPSEALGVKWENINLDFSQITFEGSPQKIKGEGIVWSKGSKNFKKGSRRSASRTIPTNLTLKECLAQRYDRLNSPKGNSLVFPSKSGKYIDYFNFCRRAWRQCVKAIDGLEKITPYNLRDTFITNQLCKGVPIAVIAAWCDNSPSMIESRYTDYVKLAIGEITPERF